MASRARTAFDKNAEDIERLLEIHENVGGTAKGRRYGLEVLNKSAIVLMTAVWEAYCEDIASEGLEHLIRHLKDPNKLPKALRKSVAKDLKADLNELSVWTISGEGWKTYLRDRLSEMKEERDRKLNTPKAANIADLFYDTVGIEDISKNWKWDKKMTVPRAKSKLDKMVTLRGTIAHRGQNSTSVTKAQVTDFFEFIKKMVAKTGGAVNTHVRSVTAKPLWKK